MIGGNGFAIVPPHDPPTIAAPGAASIQTTIDAQRGCRNLVQRILRLPSKSSVDDTHPVSEEVAYVAEGTVRVETEWGAVEGPAGTGFLIPPATPYRLTNAASADVVIVSVLSPPPNQDAGASGGRAESKAIARPERRPGGPAAASEAEPIAAVREADEEPLPAGDDRTFKLLIDPRYGCRNVTQFAGFIRRSRAPFHTHTYEEVIYVLDGTGILHAGDQRVPFAAGTSVFLSPGTPHCLENASEATLHLLGVFSPAGSPADKQGPEFTRRRRP
jgi:quercetin dioxygenase-like cupin family protein